jgi:hypothetical protein
MSPTTHRLGEVEIESLADARAFALTDDRRKKLLSEQFECTFCWTNSDSEPVALTEARRRPPRAGGHQIHPGEDDQCLRWEPGLPGPHEKEGLSLCLPLRCTDDQLSTASLIAFSLVIPVGAGPVKAPG